MQINFLRRETYIPRIKYNNISQVCPYKNLGSAKDYIIILTLLNATKDGRDKSVDKCRVKK